MPSVTESRVIAAPRTEVWAALANVENAGRWNTSWTAIEVVSPHRHGEGTRFRATTEDGQTFEFVVSEWSPEEAIAFAPVRGEDEERFGIMLEWQRFELSDGGEGSTRVRLTAQATAHGLRGHLVARLLWPGYQSHGLRLALDGLQKLLEPGQPEGDEEEADAGATPASE